jgi:transposase-like protein
MNQKANQPAASTGKRTRRTFDDALKTKIVLDALKEAEPLAVLASRYDVHPNQIAKWRKEFLANAHMAFSGDVKAEQEIDRIAAERDEYAKKVGELTMDVDFLKKNLKKLGMM